MPQSLGAGCPPLEAAVTVQPGLPVTPPLPGGTRLTHATLSPNGDVLLAGVIPTDLRSAVLFFRNDLAAAGFVSEEGDAEQDEAEAPFKGQGIQGRWKVHGILACPNAVTLELVFQPAAP